MVRATEEFALSPDQVSLYCANDIQLANLPVLIFHGPSTSANATLNSSRIQIHVCTSAGFQSYPRITISPNSPFYQSVNYLPRERQGDETCRGIAFGLLKYFKELPDGIKSALILQSTNSRRKPGSTPVLFGEQHAADLAAAMVKVENAEEVIQDLKAAFQPQNIHHLDVDLVLPPGSIAPFKEVPEEYWEDEELPDPILQQYGTYAPLVKLFGEVAFLPTSKLRRAPSKPTSLNRTRSFLKNQKTSLRREMAELVDTEERYVAKLHELVNHIADDFRGKARTRAYGSASPSEQDLEKLFPQSLDQILSINSDFLDQITKVMNDTEEEAMQDLESAIISSTSSRHGGTGRLKDPTGALAFAKVLLEWFPRFAECYQDYLHASQEFPQIITSFMRQPSSFAQRVQQTGEQRLRSAIIEPVQRLPRYSLFIDNIVNFLPVAHPALQSMLKARDIITSICSMDSPSGDRSQVVNRLRNLVDAWPTSLHPQGRLITAVDFAELSAPYNLSSSSSQGLSREGVLLFFADCVVILKKVRESTMTARGIMAEVDKPTAAVMMAPVTAAAGGEKHIYEISFSGWHVLSDTRFTMSDDGRAVWMTSLSGLKDAGVGRERNQPATVRMLVLKGSYDGKALKLTDEITRARLEGRFSETERETDKWSYRSLSVPAAEISLHTAIFEEGVATLIEGRRDPAPIRVVVEFEKGTKGAPIGHYGVDVVANFKILANGARYRLEVDGLNDKLFADEVVLEHVLPTFAKRLTSLISSQYSPSNPSLAASFISFYTKVLKSVNLQVEGEKTKHFRPPSPVKILSNFLSSNFSSSTNSFTNSTSMHSASSKNSRTLLGDIPSMQPSMTRTNSNRSAHSVQEFDGRNSVRVESDVEPSNHLRLLEQTFTGYIAALCSRKGNIVGKLLRQRSSADDLVVNAIYNTFIENPFDTRTSSEVTVDVLFVALEKFVRMAWRDSMGELMPLKLLASLQEKALTLPDSEFADHVRLVSAEMTPQNRRGFIALVKLLADLLEGCGNDGDRGALTVAFTELLVIDGDPHEYVFLLDRLVEDADRIFEGIGPGAITMGDNVNSAYGSISGSFSGARSNYSATGSVTSNNSSFRKRFGAGLFGDKKDTDPRRPLLRSLSKNSRSIATGEVIGPSSLSKVSLNRSRSIESAHRRPISRDRPTVFGTFEERPSSSHSPATRLSTIGASPPQDENKSKSRKKSRRSSLSDLRALMTGTTLESSLDPLSPSNRKQSNTSPRTPSPTKIPIMDRNRWDSFRTGSPNQKESSPVGSSVRKIGGLTERAPNIPSPASEVAKQLWPKGHAKSASMSSSGIPVLRDRAMSTSRPTSSPQKGGPPKMRLQSPQKIRERINQAARMVEETDLQLISEMSAVKQELNKADNANGSNSDPARISKLVSDLEVKIPTMRKEHDDRFNQIKADLETTLQASDYKVKELDQLYKESAAENELLYEKFNGELGKIVKALRGKGKDEKEELVIKIKESSEEASKMKKENLRLKRELLGLRARLKALEG